MSDKLLIFDLDGTLINSIGGIANSVNRARVHIGAQPLPKPVIQEYIGDGSRKLAERAFADLKLEESDFENAFHYMVDAYAAEPVVDSAPYPGVLDGLKKMKEAGFRLTVFSNKPERVGSLILNEFGIMELLDDNIGGGTGFPLKPAPDAIFHLMKKFAATPDGTYMVGDNHTDLNVATNAGVKSVFAEYGFGHRREAKADYTIANFTELVQNIFHL